MTTEKRTLASYFQTITLDNRDTRVTFTDDIPEWLHDACGQAMHHCISDWAYEACEAVCSEIDNERFEGRDYQDAIHEWADSYVDVYTKDLAQWYALHCLTEIYSNAESEAEDFGVPNASLDVNKILSVIQFCALHYLASCIVEAWRQHNEDMGDEDQESADDDYAAVAEKDNATHEKDICPCNACHDERQGT